MKYLLLAVLSVSVYFSTAQNVGIGTNNPTQKLDVNGNINVNGTIIANGIGGNPGQVLITNSSGLLEWGNFPDNTPPTTPTPTVIPRHDSTVVYQAGPSTCSGGPFCIPYNTYLVTIPANVDRVRIRAWGPGGTGISISANQTASGGGGGYIEGIAPVSSGQFIGITVGENTGISGPTRDKTTQVILSDRAFKAFSGEDANNSLNGLWSGGEGGGFALETTIPPNDYRTWIGLQGQPGGTLQFRFEQTSANTFGKAITGANGGDGAMTYNTGGKGAYQYSANGTVVSAASQGYKGRTPGGGGGTPLPDNFGDIVGGKGLVIITFSIAPVSITPEPPTPTTPFPNKQKQ